MVPRRRVHREADPPDASAGTPRWRWCTALRHRDAAPGGHIPPSLRRRRCTRSPSITSSAAAATTATAATRCSTRATPPPACTPARSSKAGSPSRHLVNFRREMGEGGGLSSYPHPWLMPDFWEFPTVSMGLGPIMAIYQARFNRYLHRPRDQGPLEEARVGLPRRRRDRRARNARRHHAGLAGAAGQPHLRHQLQPPAARRPRPRQRQDHSRARRRLPRGGLERHQGHLGIRLGSASSTPTKTASSLAHDGSS